MPNYLIHENSPYLLQHANNPVDWYPWGAEAFEKARQEDKPIFLSIGYAACHWCHVMAHESFENPAVAALMNQYFINIKVDREERPDIDSIYMQAVVALTQQGGWPMSVFLTPDGKPFYGGTYFPPVRRYNMPAFPEVLQAIAQIWLNDRSRLLESSQELARHLQQSASLDQQPGATLKPEILQHAAEALAKNYDWTHGGWGRAPKFPQPMAIEFLLRRTVGGDLFARDIALHALRAMAKGGMYDVVGGGFARYSVDDLWLIPHFEKMLYDNAQLALVYLHAYLLTGDTGFRQICEETLDFIQREMTHPEGGFFSSLDADSEGEEGKFYLWSRSEIEQTLSPEESRWITAAFGVTENGNFEGKNILQRVLSDEKLAEKFNVKAAEVPAILKIALSRLLTARSSRVRPGTDDKVLVFWNSMALAAFAEAGRYLERADYLETARHNAQFLLNKLYVDNRLLRSWRAGQSRHNAYLEDYAGLVQALLALYMSDPDPRWYQSALQLCDEMIAHFSDPKGGFFDTRDDHEALLYRPKELNDNATPSGNALAACAILQLAAYGDRTALVSTANKMIISMQDAMVRYPSAFAQWLCAADFALGAIQEVAVIGDPHNAQTQALQRALWQNYRPHLVAAVSDIPPAPGSPALLADRPMLAGSPTAYVCQGFVCQQPVTSPQAMLAQLNTR